MAIRHVPFADLGAQYRSVERDLSSALKDLLLSGKYIGGLEVTKFENEFAAYVGSDYCVGVGNGTDALEILLKAADLPAGSTVLVPDNSFVATAEAVLNLGHNVRLVDADAKAGMDRDSLIENLDSNVSAVVVVHLFGRPNDVSFLTSIAAERGIAILEDCAQAHGARYQDGRHVGTSGLGAAFSFYPGKNLGAIGDAGAIVTSNKILQERARRIANHGRLEKYDHDLLGRNSRLDSIQALVLSSKLRLLDKWVSVRRKNAQTYFNLLADTPLVLPPAETHSSAFHLFVVQTPLRDELRAYLKAHGVETGIHYPKAISEYEPYRQFSLRNPNHATELAKKSLSLPVGEHLSREDLEYVGGAVKAFFELTP